MDHDSTISPPREEAIARGVLWLVHDLWVTGPLPRLELERRIGRKTASFVLARGFVRSVPTGNGALCTPGARGRQALGLDDGHLSPPHALTLAFARRAAAEVLLEGLSSGGVASS